MTDPSGPVNTDGLLQEYSAVRAEIQQLNAQVIAILTGALAVNASVLGWLFGKESPRQFYPLPTVGVFLLVLANVVLLNRNRLAHRLALFQRYFLEPRLPGTCWGTVYFAYRDRFLAGKGLASWVERLTDSAFLLIVGLVNLVVLVAVGLLPYTPGTSIDWLQVGNFGVAVVLLVVGWYLRARLVDYSTVDEAMRELAAERGLTPRCTRPAPGGIVSAGG